MVKVKNKRNSGLSEKVHNKRKAEASKKQLNPFEVHINREKIQVLGKKSKHDRGLPGVSRAKAIQKRKETIGTELKLVNKTNAFIDRRIGEKNAQLSSEDRLIARFAAERVRQHTKKNIYNLADDEILTHRGQTLEDIEKFDDPRSSDEEDEDGRKGFGGLDDEFVSEGHFGGGVLSRTDAKDGAKSHKDLIEQLIAESKKRKAEKQKEKEQTLDMTEKLDSEWKDLQPVVFKRPRIEEKPVEEKSSIVDNVLSKVDKKAEDYDKTMRELRFEKRGTPSDGLKNEEQLEREERSRIEELEKQREIRMSEGDISTTAPNKHRSADDLDDNFELDDGPDYMLSYDKDGNPNIPEHIVKQHSGFPSSKKFDDGYCDTSSDDNDDNSEDDDEEEDPNKETEKGSSNDISDAKINGKLNNKSNAKEFSDDDSESDNDEENIIKEIKKTAESNKINQKTIDISNNKCQSDSSDEEVKENKVQNSKKQAINDKKSDKINKKIEVSNKSKVEEISDNDSESEDDNDEQSSEDEIENKIESIKNTKETLHNNTINKEGINNKSDDDEGEASDNEEDSNDDEDGEEESNEDEGKSSDDDCKISNDNKQVKTAKKDKQNNKDNCHDYKPLEDYDDFRDFQDSDKESECSDLSENANEKITTFFSFDNIEDNLKELLEGKTSKEQSKALDTLIDKYDPSLSKDNKEKLHRLFAHLLQYLNDTFTNLKTEEQITNAFRTFDKLAPYFYRLTHKNKFMTKKYLIELITEKRNKYLKKTKLVPDLDTLIFFKLVSLLYPTSDFKHPVVTPCFVFMSEILHQSNFNSAYSISRGLFITTLLLEYTVLSKKLVPAKINFLRGIIYLCANISMLNPITLVPPFKLRKNDKYLNLDCDCSEKAIDSKMAAKDLVADQVDDSFKIRCLATCVDILKETFDYFNDIEAQECLFKPHIDLLDKVDIEWYPKEIALRIMNTVKYMKEILEVKTFKPLTVERKKPKALRLYEPDVQEVFTDSKSSKCKTKAERDKLKHKLKKEMKGALREIRRDKSYIASVKIRQKILSDNIRKDKVKQIYKDASIQQGELNKLKRKN